MARDLKRVSYEALEWIAMGIAVGCSVGIAMVIFQEALLWTLAFWKPYLGHPSGMILIPGLGLFLSVVVSLIYGLANDWGTLIPAVILTQVMMRMIVPVLDIIFIGSINPKQRGVAMGFSRTIWAIPQIFVPIIAATIVSNFGGINTQGIRPLYFIQLVLGIIVLLFVFFKLKTPPAMPTKEKGESEPRSFIQDLKDVFKGENWLKRWMVLMSVWMFGMRVSMPFIPLWMVSKGADPYILGLMGTVGVLVSTFLQIPVGKLADKIGRKKTFYLLAPFGYLGTILLILTPDPRYLVLVGFLGGAGQVGGGGGIGGVSFSPLITMNWEMVSAEKRGRWFGVRGIFMFLNVPASIIGGILWQQGYMIEVLLIPILLQVLIVIPILATVPDTLGRSKQ